MSTSQVIMTALEELAVARQEGALILLEAEPDSLKELQRQGASDQELTEILLKAFEIAQSHLAQGPWARTSWNRFEAALSGSRESLIQSAKAIVTQLTAQSVCAQLSWRIILTRIFPGEAARTQRCDPAYDLNGLNTSAVVWVEPYPGEDWQESQRYPTVEIVWQRR